MKISDEINKNYLKIIFEIQEQVNDTRLLKHFLGLFLMAAVLINGYE